MQALTGVWAARHSEELKRGITIKLGYADMPVYKCPKCLPPQNYSTEPTCPNCNSSTEFQRAISFVDAPGHEALMATMLSGAAVMDGALLVIAADESCPQPQTREHLAAIQIMGLEHIVIVQNKIDIVGQERALQSFKEIREFVKGTVAEKAPIIPVSAQHNVNTDALIQAMEEFLPTPKRDLTKPPLMYVVRSFDINKPGTPIDDLSGGVIGGTIIQGKFKVDDEIEIRPGIRVQKDGKTIYESVFSRIVSLHVGGQQLEEAQSGGLIGVGTLLDPSLTRADGLTGNLVGKPDMLPPTMFELTVDMHLFEQAIGTKELVRVDKVRKGETLLLDVGASITVGTTVSIKGKTATLKLARPVCTQEGSRAAISRKIGGRWRLIGYGIIK